MSTEDVKGKGERDKQNMPEWEVRCGEINKDTCLRVACRVPSR